MCKRSRRTRRSHAVSPQQQHFEALTTSPPMRGSHLRTGRQAARSDSSLASPPSPFGNYFAIYFNSELLQTLARGATAPAGRWGGSRAARRQPMPPRLLRRLHGARRARGTSLCPGHILLFGHVKILILSLLSKSLPIKGREARPAAKVEGRAGANTRAVHSQGELSWTLVLSLIHI